MTFDDLDGTHFYAQELYDTQDTVWLRSVLVLYEGDLKHGSMADEPDAEDWFRQQVRAIRRTLTAREELA